MGWLHRFYRNKRWYTLDFPKRADQEKQADAKQRRFLAQHVFREVKQARNSIQKLSRRSTRD